MCLVIGELNPPCTPFLLFDRHAVAVREEVEPTYKFHISIPYFILNREWGALKFSSEESVNAFVVKCEKNFNNLKDFPQFCKDYSSFDVHMCFPFSGRKFENGDLLLFFQDVKTIDIEKLSLIQSCFDGKLSGKVQLIDDSSFIHSRDYSEATKEASK